MKTAITVFSVSVAAAIACCLDLWAEGQDRVVGYYYNYMRPSQLPLGRLKDYTTTVFIRRCGAAAGKPSAADLDRIKASGMNAIVQLSPDVVETKFDAEDLTALKRLLDKYRGIIRAIYAIDEPYKISKGYSEEKLKVLIDRVRGIFVGYPIFVNFLAPYYVQGTLRGKPYPGYPDNIDMISVDIYLWYPEDKKAEYMMRMKRNLDMVVERAKGRPIFLATRSCHYKGEPEKWPAPYLAQWDYELFSQYRFWGLGWYFYEEENFLNGKMWGSTHYPKLIEKQRHIGRMIMAPVKQQTGPPVPPGKEAK